MTLPALRRQIDRLDRQILRLLNQRAARVVRVGRLKRAQKRPVFDRRRERAIVRQLAKANRGPLPAASVRAIFTAVLRHSRKLESKTR